MNWLKDLIDPRSRKNLEWNNQENLLSTSENIYRVINGIPIFNPELNFDDHWENNFTEEIPNSKLLEAKDFLKPVWEINNLSGLKILDGGCGDGVHLKTLSDNIKDSIYYGIDISTKALTLCQKRLNGNIRLIQSSIDRMPFTDDYFDIVYSYGVIAYTPDPKKSFQELVAKVKPNGLIGVWIYPKTKGLAGLLFSLVRFWCKISGKYGTLLLANAIVPFMSFLPTRSKLTLKNATWKQCREIVMVNIAPSQLYFPDPNEIIDWFKGNNVTIIRNDPSNPISIWGRKQ